MFGDRGSLTQQLPEHRLEVSSRQVLEVEPGEELLCFHRHSCPRRKDLRSELGRAFGHVRHPRRMHRDRPGPDGDGAFASAAIAIAAELSAALPGIAAEVIGHLLHERLLQHLPCALARQGVERVDDFAGTFEPTTSVTWYLATIGACLL